MELVEVDNAAEYLRRTARIAADELVTIDELPGGVSNRVLYVARPETPGGDFVLKQAREQLRTPAPWFCTVERVWREVDVLRWCARSAPSGQTPEVLFQDRENYLFAMSAAPRPFDTWKAELLSGAARPEVAADCGRLLGAIHAGTWDDEDAAAQLGDRTLFEELRVDPYYRAVARAHSGAAPAIEALIESLATHPLCLVHADFAPKNLLLHPAGMMLVDFETGHYGDPAFDLGFFLSHLVLKALWHAPGHEPFLALTRGFWSSYQQELSRVASRDQWQALEERAIRNWAACAWARVDGVSQVEYLRDETRRALMRRCCQETLAEPPLCWEDLLSSLSARMAPVPAQREER